MNYISNPDPAGGLTKHIRLFGRGFHVLLAFVFIAAGTAQAETLTWDISTDPGIQDGDGQWDDNVTPNWTADEGASNQNFIDANVDRAVFGNGSTGTVTLASTIRTFGNGITFNDGYTIDTDGFQLGGQGNNNIAVTTNVVGASITGTGNYHIFTSTTITVGTGADIAISAQVTGSNAGNNTLTKTGNGTLTLANVTNNFGDGTIDTGLQVNDGIVAITSIADTGTPSAAGDGGFIALGGTAVLRYTGAGGETINRELRLEGGGGNNGIDNRSGGLLTLTGDIVNSLTTGRLDLIGNTGSTNEIQSVLADNGENPLSIQARQQTHAILSGRNTFTGDIAAINNTALLTIGGDGALGWNGSEGDYSGDIRMNQGGDFEYASSADQILRGVISDDGNNDNSVTMSGSGTLVLSATNTYTGGTTIRTGTLEFRNNDALAGRTDMGPGGVLQFGADGLDLSKNVRISNNGGNKTIRLDLADTNSGMLSGTLDIRQVDAGAFDIDVGLDDTLAVSNAIVSLAAGGAGLTKAGDGTLIIEVTSSYAGDTTVNGGTLRIVDSSEAASSWGAGNIVINNGSTLALSDTVGDTRMVFSGKTFTFGESGNGMMDFEAGAMLMRGITVTTSGGARNTVQSSGGSFTSQQFDPPVFDVADGTDPEGIDLDVTLNITSAGSSTGALVKDGDGTVRLSGTTSYHGPTTITAGTLVMDGAYTQTGAWTVNSGGAVGGSGSINGATTVASEAAVAPGSGADTGMLTFTTSLDLEAGSVLNMELVTTGDHDTIVISGAESSFTSTAGVILNIQGAPAEGDYTLVDGTGIGTWTTDVADYSLVLPTGFSGEIQIVDQTLVLSVSLLKGAVLEIR